MTCAETKIRFAVVNTRTRVIDMVFNTYSAASHYCFELPKWFMIVGCSDEQLQNWARNDFVVPHEYM
jgi:hypothetical protein